MTNVTQKHPKSVYHSTAAKLRLWCRAFNTTFRQFCNTKWFLLCAQQWAAWISSSSSLLRAGQLQQYPAFVWQKKIRSICGSHVQALSRQYNCWLDAAVVLASLQINHGTWSAACSCQQLETNTYQQCVTFMHWSKGVRGINRAHI